MGEAEVAGQAQLFPLRAIRCDPANLGTADCTHICRCDDGSDYAIKFDKPTRDVRHVEWFCYRLAERIGLACPPSRVVDMAGSLVFGSRWETGEIKNWWLAIQAGDLTIDDLKASVSRMYALDLFVHNEDRHLNNYFVRRQHLGCAMISMDFSRSWLCCGFPPKGDLPLAPSCNTIQAHRILTVSLPGLFELPEFATVLDELRKVKVDEIKEYMGSHPEEWLPENKQTSILDWWNSKDRLDRIDRIFKGLHDGTYR